MRIGRDYYIPDGYKADLRHEDFRRRNGITADNRILFELEKVSHRSSRVLLGV